LIAGLFRDAKGAIKYRDDEGTETLLFPPPQGEEETLIMEHKGLLYCEFGELKYRRSDGHVTTLTKRGAA